MELDTVHREQSERTIFFPTEDSLKNISPPLGVIRFNDSISIKMSPPLGVGIRSYSKIAPSHYPDLIRDTFGIFAICLEHASNKTQISSTKIPLKTYTFSQDFPHNPHKNLPPWQKFSPSLNTKYSLLNTTKN